MLAQVRGLGVDVKIDDEGGYWPRHDVAELQRRIDRMNGLMAAMAGALKDDADDRGLAPWQATVFAHPDFEQMEAFGIECEKYLVFQAMNLLKRQTHLTECHLISDIQLERQDLAVTPHWEINSAMFVLRTFNSASRESLGEAHPLTAPPVRPAINSRWRSRKMHMTGEIDTRVPAMMRL